MDRLSGLVGYSPDVTCGECGVTATPDRYMFMPPGWGQVWVRVTNSRGILDVTLKGKTLCPDCIKEEMR